MRRRSKSVCDRGEENSPVEIQPKRLCFDENTRNPDGKNAQSRKRKPIVTSNPTSVPAKPILKQKPPSEIDTSKSMIDVVANNCELSNALIDLTKKLSNKQNDYEHLMIRYFAAKKEKWFLQQKLVRRDNIIADLQRTLKDMNEARFCGDLIQIDGAVTAKTKVNFPYNITVMPYCELKVKIFTHFRINTDRRTFKQIYTVYCEHREFFYEFDRFVSLGCGRKWTNKL